MTGADSTELLSSGFAFGNYLDCTIVPSLIALMVNHILAKHNVCCSRRSLLCGNRCAVANNVILFIRRYLYSTPKEISSQVSPNDENSLEWS
jgi:hypothetical protein